MTNFLVLLLGVAVLTTGRAPAAEPAPTNAAPAGKPEAKTPDLFGNPLVAKGKGVEIKRSQLDEEVIRTKSQLAASGRPLPPDQTAQVERQILEQMINVQLLQAKATEADKAAGKELAEKRLADAKTKLGAEQFNRQLKLMNATPEEVVAKWAEAMTADAVLKRELKVTVTDEEVKKFYDDNPSQFEKPEMVRASHILLTTRDPATGAELPDDKKAAKRQQIEALLKRARAGEDFAKLAQESSEDPGSKDKGGEYQFPRGQMVPEFEAAAFSLKTNQVSDIVTSSFGYHIIKLSEKIPAQKVELAKAAADIKEGLTRQALQKQFPDYIAKLKQAAGVEILDEKLKSKATADSPGLPPGHPPVQPEKKPDAK
jgi:peptidyl-prolyl cis-trans isomerase C